MPTATLTTVTLETIGRPKPSKYEGKPDYRPCLFVLPDGSQRWKSYNEGSPELDWLKKGQTYQATLTGDDLTIIQPQGQPTDQAQPAPQPQAAPMPTATPGSYAAGPAPTIPDDRKRQIAQYLQDLAALYAYSYSTAKHQLEPHDAPAEAIQGAATTLFIQASRKFNL
jgi:hypothetical protein